MKVSLAMIVKNEEKTIIRCLSSIKKIVDEIIIVDTGSTDNTINILKTYSNVKLFHYAWCDDFSLARNFALDQCTGDYILSLDADEYVTYGKKKDLEMVMKKKNIGQISIESQFRKDNQIFKSTSYVSRFFPKGIRYEGAIHEQLISDNPREKMNFKVNHDGYLDNDKGVRNIPLLKRELKRNPRDSYYLYQLGKELRINKQFSKAFSLFVAAYQYIEKASPYYPELVVEIINSGKEVGDTRVLSIIQENEKTLERVTDFHFSKGLYYMEYCFKFPDQAHYYFSNIESSFLHCLNLKDKPHIEYLHGTSDYLAAYNLAVFYEVTNNLKKAESYYRVSARKGYELAKGRLFLLKETI